MSKQEVKEQVVTRLHGDVYHALEKQCQPALVNQTTTELMAGYLLGQAHVLEKLRNGFVVNTSS